ncbi:MAG TPA: response regulator transcription factor [Acidimicrobiales bacterium]|nr:response regulator transcription factor [Acidimicrobiales bacterium]
MERHGGYEPSDPAGDEGRLQRVLLVDDDAGLRAVLKALLESEGSFEVVAESSDGRDAVGLAQRYSPDVIVLDLAMPGIGGLEALPLLRNVVGGARIVVATALEADGFRQEAFRLGADDYWLKGAEFETLLSLMRTPVPRWA